MPRSASPPQQLSLYPDLDRTTVYPASVNTEGVAATPLPAGIRLGTSSWSFPGWHGLVWRDRHDPATLSRVGLAAYAAHPRLAAVGLDRTYYAPMTTPELRDLAAQVPADFRFLMKAHERCTRPQFRDGSTNPHFLDSAYAAENVVAPYVHGLGKRGGALLFQFSRLAQSGAPERFAERLQQFLGELPVGPRYAVELRDAELVIERYRQALAAANAVHCYNVHTHAPDLARQSEVAPPEDFQVVVVRWMLRPGLDYASARKRLDPFDQLRLPDTDTRARVAELISRAHRAGREVLVTVNNKAEGSAPWSVIHLADAVQARLRADS